MGKSPAVDLASHGLGVGFFFPYLALGSKLSAEIPSPRWASSR